MSRVLLALDKFKGSLTAAEATRHLMTGLRRAAEDAELIGIPVADGGDGTVDAILAAGFERVTRVVEGPTGRPVEASLAVRGETAVVESAQASGLLRLQDGPEPLAASSFGTGQLIDAVVRMGCRRVILGVGGSACTDGGAGMLQALGARLRDIDGTELPPGGAALRRLHDLDLSGLLDMTGVTVLLATDVTAPLLGPKGAAPVYGPQKGAGPEDVAVLEAGLTRWAEVLESRTMVACAAAPGAGAAGGIGFAALAALGAERLSGIDLVLDLTGFRSALHGASLVVTGEGRIDAQTAHGKAPAGVARAAARAGVPTVAVAGSCALSDRQLRRLGLAAAYTLSGIEPDPRACHENAGPLLEKLAAHIARDWLAADAR
ncbi:glycerate kinase [Spirillospora sp. NPDC127506]